jgi:dTDP-D-glucose 4,6-dehydratase
MAQSHWICDSAAIHRDLGWSASTNLTEGARHTARWYRQHGWI